MTHIYISPDISDSLASKLPVVALESTVIAHGLPYPKNIETALACEETIRNEGAMPATIGVIDGTIIVGLNSDQIEKLGSTPHIRKVSRRDFGIVVARKEPGATTVAGTMIVAHIAGIRVFSTGGIGGVHRGDAGDISADLPELARTPVAVVCAGAKSILDLPRTVEWLETAGVPVLGYQSDTFPAFYAISSNLPVDECIDSPEEAASIIETKWGLGLGGGVLIVVPPPADVALPFDEVENAVAHALERATEKGIRGKEITPFLLSEINQLTSGRSLAVNIALLTQNARIAARIAKAMSASRR